MILPSKNKKRIVPGVPGVPTTGDLLVDSNTEFQ
jgi:hypothetical protein